MRKRRIDDIDDGRVIAPMNVEGMPWYTPKAAPNKTSESPSHEPGAGLGLPEKMTREESRAFSFGVLKAVLLVAFALIGGYFVFILFCVKIWFR